MIRVNITFTRPNTSVNFVGPEHQLLTGDFKTYFFQNYIQTSKMVHEERTVSEDGLTLTLARIWQDQATWDDFKSDQFVIDNLITPRDSYFAENGITQSEIVVDNV
jgi:hypothetical protein